MKHQYFYLRHVMKLCETEFQESSLAHITGADKGDTYNYGAPYIHSYTSQLLLILLVYPQQIREYIFIFAFSDKWGVTEFIQCLVHVLIRNHELSVTQVIGRNDNGYNSDNRPSFIRYRILQLSPIGSVTEHRLGLWYNITNAIEECKEYSITMYSSRGYNIRTYERTE